jgi:murein DD-endopeptidase MepM/ murein hydrolase activator NlpD
MEHGMKHRSRATVVAALAVAAVIISAAPVAAHTVTWNPSTYTTPITDWANPNYRCAPITTWYGEGGHTGGQYYAIDISVPVGADVYAPKAGWAWYQWNGSPGGGNMINIKHTETGGSLTTVLAHLSTIRIRTDGVSQWVNKNQWIGESGNSGGVAPHLHWQMNVSDHMQDGRYGSDLDLIPGVNGPPTRTVCG